MGINSGGIKILTGCKFLSLVRSTLLSGIPFIHADTLSIRLCNKSVRVGVSWSIIWYCCLFQLQQSWVSNHVRPRYVFLTAQISFLSFFLVFVEFQKQANWISLSVAYRFSNLGNEKMCEKWRENSTLIYFYSSLTPHKIRKHAIEFASSLDNYLYRICDTLFESSKSYFEFPEFFPSLFKWNRCKWSWLHWYRHLFLLNTTKTMISDASKCLTLQRSRDWRI